MHVGRFGLGEEFQWVASTVKEEKSKPSMMLTVRLGLSVRSGAQSLAGRWDARTLGLGSLGVNDGLHTSTSV